MRTIVVLFVLACVAFGCGNKTTEETATTDSTASAVTLPFEFSYKGKFAIGSMTNVQTVMACNKRLSELNADVGEFMADSVSLYLSDGMSLIGPRDSVVAGIGHFINGLSAMKIEYTTAIPLDNVDLNQQWVSQWTAETYTYKDGKVETFQVHEDYLMKNGKISALYQYSAKPAGKPEK